MTTDELAAEFCPAMTGEGKHCLHVSAVQHAAMYHRDEHCCNCGQSWCLSTLGEHMAYKSLHGRYL